MENEKTAKRNTTVMLVDDNSIDNFIHEKLIKKVGLAENAFIHTSAMSALEFLRNVEIIKTVSPELIPKYIFLDLNMPLHDGFVFMDEFEKFSPEIKSKVKVVILTSSINPNDVEKSKAYGSVVEYYYKPLSVDELKRLITN